MFLPVAGWTEEPKTEQEQRGGLIYLSAPVLACILLVSCTCLQSASACLPLYWHAFSQCHAPACNQRVPVCPCIGMRSLRVMHLPALNAVT